MVPEEREVSDLLGEKHTETRTEEKLKTYDWHWGAIVALEREISLPQSVGAVTEEHQGTRTGERRTPRATGKKLQMTRRQNVTHGGDRKSRCKSGKGAPVSLPNLAT